MAKILWQLYRRIMVTHPNYRFKNIFAAVAFSNINEPEAIRLLPAKWYRNTINILCLSRGGKLVEVVMKAIRQQAHIGGTEFEMYQSGHAAGD